MTNFHELLSGEGDGDYEYLPTPTTPGFVKKTGKVILVAFVVYIASFLFLYDIPSNSKNVNMYSLVLALLVGAVYFYRTFLSR